MKKPTRHLTLYMTENLTVIVYFSNKNVIYMHICLLSLVFSIYFFNLFRKKL